MLRRDSLLLALPTAALMMRLADASLGSFSYVVIAGYALFGRAQAIHALAFSWLLTMLNPGIGVGVGDDVEASVWSVGRYLVLAAAAGSVLRRSDLKHLRGDRAVRTTFWLGAALVLHSLAFSPLKAVSILKALSWTTATCTLLAAWSGLSVNGRARVVWQLFAGLTLLLLGSLPLLGLPLGYLVNGTGFQGLLAHPQVFGPTMAFLGAWAGGRILGEAKASLWLMALFAACCVLVVLSESRTAGVALLLGLAAASLLGPVIARRTMFGFLPGLRSSRLYFIAVLVLVVAALEGPTLSDSLSRFMAKRSDTEMLSDVYRVSRGDMIERMWENIQERPWRGIGFGIASNPDELVVERDPVLGLATGAAVEKGVLPMALLEELGVFGFLAVTWWFLMLARRAAYGGGVRTLVVFFTVWFVNLGESVLFSPGGLGLLCLVLLGWSVSDEPPQAAGRTTHA